MMLRRRKFSLCSWCQEQLFHNVFSCLQILMLRLRLQQRSFRIDSAPFQNPSPKCIPNVTGLVAGPPVGRLNLTGKTASTKYALKNPLSVWIGQLLFTSGVKPNCDELTSNAARTPTPMSCPTLQTTPGWKVRPTCRGESCMEGTNSMSNAARPLPLIVIPNGKPME